jgi:hypothetical protein
MNLILCVRRHALENDDGIVKSAATRLESTLFDASLQEFREVNREHLFDSFLGDFPED